MIPKIIHYCWFGGKEIPDRIKRYMASWDILEKNGYRIIRWDESNCSFDENSFVRRAYEQKRWGFLGDYYRWKFLYEYGGIYLDTDVIVNKPFDSLLSNHAFIGYMYPSYLGTAILGAEKNSTFAKKMLNMYENGAYPDSDSICDCCAEKNLYEEECWLPSNEVVTWNMIKHYPNIGLNNKYQKFEDVVVFPNYYFDRGRIVGSEYSRHMFTNTWVFDGVKKENRIKSILKENQIFNRIVALKRKINIINSQKSTSSYKYYLDRKISRNNNTSN